MWMHYYIYVYIQMSDYCMMSLKNRLLFLLHWEFFRRVCTLCKCVHTYNFLQLFHIWKWSYFLSKLDISLRQTTVFNGNRFGGYFEELLMHYCCMTCERLYKIVENIKSLLPSIGFTEQSTTLALTFITETFKVSFEKIYGAWECALLLGVLKWGA